MKIVSAYSHMKPLVEVQATKSKMDNLRKQLITYRTRGNRILYINPTAVHGGAEEALLSFMLSAQTIGFQPVLIVPSAGWLTDQCRTNNIPCELLPSLPDIFTCVRRRDQFKPLLLNAIALAQLACKWRATCIHSNSPRMSYHGGLAARLTSIAAITHCHDIVSLPYRSPLEAHLLNTLADWTLVPSQAVAQAISTYAPHLQARIQVLYNGRDISAYSTIQSANLHQLFALPQDALIIGNVAAMTPWKGQNVLIKAFQCMHADFPQTRLLIIGGAQGNLQQQQYEAQLHQQVAEAQLEGKVIFTGWREDAWSLIKSLDVFVHVPTSPDPLPTVLLHAAALSRAVIGSCIGGIPEIITDGSSGMIVPPGNVYALQMALQFLIAHPQARVALGKEAQRHFVQQFSERQMTMGLAGAYARCRLRP